MKQGLFLIISLFTATSYAQVSVKDLSLYYEQDAALCGGYDSVFAIKGKWKKLGDENTFPDKSFPKSDYKFVNARLDSMGDMLKATITDLSGMEARYYRNITGKAYIPGGPVPYTLTARFPDYYCNTNFKKILLADETSNLVYIFVNTLNWFLSKIGKWDINNDGILHTVYQLPVTNGKWKGMTVYEPDFFAGGATRIVYRAVVLGRNGKLPWRSLTQKQYLTSLKIQYEAELNKTIEWNGFSKNYSKRLKFINDYFAVADEKTLETPAVIDPKAGIWGFKGKFGDEENGGYRLVLFAGNKKYFDTTLPRYVPQLFQVIWKYNPDEKVSLHFKKQFEENFPLEKLKAMLDK
ncbi:MAG: hypothetical protein LC128_08160 [Chitinophagales bacterium]|nr:hypothetical protein [Chitinophagales bacterium]